jgi:peptidoglycan-associated lipoprotein
MKQYKTVLALSMLLALLLIAGGCKPAESPTITPAEPAEEAPPPPPPPPPTREVEDDFRTEPTTEPELTRGELIDDLNARGVLATVYFAFDSSELSESAIRTLRRNADEIQARPDLNVVVEGHCDERGTIEYNLALGERRADAVRGYLTSLGVARDRIRIITYGEERPVDPGHTESAWSRNRRGEFLFEP